MKTFLSSRLFLDFLNEGTHVRKVTPLSFSFLIIVNFCFISSPIHKTLDLTCRLLELSFLCPGYTFPWRAGFLIVLLGA